MGIPTLPLTEERSRCAPLPTAQALRQDRALPETVGRWLSRRLGQNEFRSRSQFASGEWDARETQGGS